MSDISNKLQDELDNIHEKIKGYNKAIRKDPKDPDNYARRSYQLMRIADAYVDTPEAVNAKKYMQAALRDCTKLIELKSNVFDAWVNSGLLKEKLANLRFAKDDDKGGRKLLREALDCHTAAIATGDFSPSVFCIRGNVYQTLAHAERQIGNYADAEKLTLTGIDDYDKSLELGHDEAYASRAAARILLGLYKKSVKEMDEAMELVKQSIADYDQAINCTFYRPRLYYLRAEAKGVMAEIIHKQDRKKAIKQIITSAVADYRQELEEDPRFAFALVGIASSMYMLADTCLLRGKLQEANDAVDEGIIAATDALGIRKSYVSAHYERAYLQFLGAAIAERQEDMEQAEKLVKATIADWDRAIKFDPDNETYRERRAAAKEAYQKIKQLDPKKKKLGVQDLEDVRKSLSEHIKDSEKVQH